MPTWLADGTNNFGDTREGGLAGPTGLVIILLLAIGTALLIRSMNRRLRRLPAEFPHQATTAETIGKPSDKPVDQPPGHLSTVG